MHLKSCPKLVRSELRLDASGVPMSQRSSLFMGQQAALLKTCGGNHGNTGSSRLPFSVISTNTLRRGNSTTHGVGALSLRLKTSPAALQPPPSPPGCENDDTFRLCPDADASLDIWTVIRPGHVREKIAIFALEAECTDGARASERTSTGDSDRTSLGDTAGPFRAVKAKGSWAENCRAKRRRRSGNTQQDPKTRVQETPQTPRRSDGEAAEDEEQKVSVGEMVAFLEQRASEPDAKHLLVLQRSSTTIVLARAPPPEAKEAPEVKVEESDSVRVSDMVAKLESACLRKSDGELSRSNSLRRKVGRVLLASGDQSPAPCQPPSMTSSSNIDREPMSCSAVATPASGEAVVQEAGGAEPPTEAPPPPVEPLPGLLFLTPASEPRLLRHRITLDLEPRPLLARRESDKRRAEEEECGVAAAGRCASQDFLLMRQRLQRLLEPQQFLAILPHHVLLKILLLLPTQSLAALKCSCRYFRFVIDTYGVRPADSLWVSDPRYRDDPCKQCKRRYGRGDVSLCRWHHKPYCQALPYGPGYWMCCHGAQRDAPGCNVGLHDNRWVPAFHSINVPIYRRGRHDD